VRTDSEPQSADGDSAELLGITTDTARTNTVVVTARGDVDQSTSPLFLARLQDRIHHLGPDLVVDLTRIGHFGAAGISALVHARATARAAGVDIVVVAAGRVVLRSLRITGMESVFDLYPTLADALGRPERRVLSN
jgi:anti-anti-sigma factor